MRELRHDRWGCCRIPDVVFVALLAIGGGALCGVSAAAQGVPTARANLIANPDFDTGVAGWTPQMFALTDTDPASRGWSASVKWAPERDFEGRRSSGSLELAITAAEGRCAVATQCFVASPGIYELTGEVFIHATDVHTRGAVVELELFWSDSGDCTTSTHQFTRWSIDPRTAAMGRWTQIVDPTTFTMVSNFDPYDPSNRGQTGLIPAPKGTRGAQLRLSACASGYSKSTETVIANFDHLGLRAVPAGGHARAGNSSSHP